MYFTIYADGGARGNPGPAGAGAVVHDESGKLIASISKFLGHQTNNFAEYEAVILAFEALIKITIEESKNKLGGELTSEIKKIKILVKLDSELIVKQMNKIYKVKNLALQKQHARLTRLVTECGTVSFMHIPRKENSAADALANTAMDRGAQS